MLDQTFRPKSLRAVNGTASHYTKESSEGKRQITWDSWAWHSFINYLLMASDMKASFIKASGSSMHRCNEWQRSYMTIFHLVSHSTFVQSTYNMLCGYLSLFIIAASDFLPNASDLNQNISSSFLWATNSEGERHSQKQPSKVFPIWDRCWRCSV